MKKIFLTLFFLLVGAKNVLAAEGIGASLVSTYTINEGSAGAKVSHEFTVENLSPTTFVDSYQITLAHDNLVNLIVDPKEEEIEKKIEKVDGQTKIDLTFANEVVGEGKKRAWVVNYNDGEMAKFMGAVTDINIPLLADAASYANYKVVAQIPTHLGEPTKINVAPGSKKQIGGGLTEYVWQDLAGQTSLNLTFGAKQMLNFSLRYTLLNETGNPLPRQIALPADDNWQTVIYENISPQPESMTVDNDGNYLATYTLEPSQELIVNVAGEATLIEQNEVKTSLSEEAQKQYLRAAGVWKTETGENITDDYIAAARQQGTPARRVVGWTAESETNNLQTWVEYFDAAREMWRRTDPSLEKNSGRDYTDNFDLFHFALAKNGYSSELPEPPGEVIVNYQEAVNKNASESASFSAVLSPTVQIKTKHLGFLPLPGFYELEIKNEGGKTWHDLAVYLNANENSEAVTVKADERLLVPSSLTVLPFSTQIIPLTVYNNSPANIAKMVNLTVTLGSAKENINVRAEDKIITFSFVSLGIAAGVLALAVTGGSILVARRKK